MAGTFSHRSVLLDECIEGLNIRPDGIYIDGTLGRGGHSEQIAMRLTQGGRLICIDRDIQAIREAGERLAPFADRITILEQDAGLHFLLRVDTQLTDRELTDLCARSGIRVKCLSDYYEGTVPGWAEKCLVVNYSGVDVQTLAAVLIRLAASAQS